ncbi:Cof-type HAD-IIB family hydrolase [Tannockella kyphosi]|uniref:Cof-type HAD-IIB family hydrolase n=1 Tax=Tannockella kyphosi TaxID=2899121 RepID=UPI00201177A7|nr:Cof-type HAD-IIB family hydrolase [Tannockella kyphosi]
MYKLMLSDLDETLIVNHHVPTMNIEAIKKAREKGMKFVPATGRGYMMVTEILEELDALKKEGEYTICYNGGMIIENKNDRILYFKGVTYELAEKLTAMIKSYPKAGLLLFSSDHCYMIHPIESEVERKTTQKCPFTILKEEELPILKDVKLVKILYVYPDMDCLKQIEKECQKEIATFDVSVSYSSNRYLEFNAAGVDKGAALRFLANYLGIEVEETIAIGDNYNDLEMIKAAGLGVAVSNANQDVKDNSDYVTVHDYYEGAVKETIEKFVLGENDGI